jgi:hypothetical protein
MAAGYVPQRELQLKGHERQANRRKVDKRALTTAAVAFVRGCYGEGFSGYERFSTHCCEKVFITGNVYVEFCDAWDM